MEYQQKKEQILSGVEFTSLLSFNLVENKLERNFRAIVDALLLAQGRNEELASKTEQLDDRQAMDRQKNSQEHETLKQALKAVNDRVAKLENAASSPPTKAPHNNSSKNIKEGQKSEMSQRGIPSGSQLQVPLGKNSFLEKKMNDVIQEISALKERMPTLKLMENELENMKRDLTSLRGQLMTIGKSSKSIKRESINPPPMRPSFRRESASKGTKPAGLSHSNSSVLLQEVDKENRSQHIDAKQGNRVQTNASNIISGGDTEVERELQGLHIEVNTLNLCFQELKGLVEDLRKKDIRYHSTIAELEDRQRKMQDQMRKDSQAFEKALKGVQLDIMGLGNDGHSERAKQPNMQMENKEGKQVKQSRQGKKGGSGGSLPGGRDEQSINFKNQLNDKINKLQNSLNGFISESEFNRFKAEMRGRIEQGERKHQKLVNQFQQQIRKIYDMFINKDLDLARVNELIAANAETIKEHHSQAQRKHNIAIARADQLKKNLQNLREDVEFYQAMNNDSKQVKAKAEEKKEGQMKAQGQGGSGVDPKALEELKKYFNNKLHDQRAYLVGLIRDLQKKQNSASAVNQEIANLWDKANQLATFLSKKGDAEDIKKSLVYLQKKINKIGSQLMKAEDNTEDARIARTNWFCLSCDKNLLGYQGKLGKHVVWDSMPLKGTVKGVDKKGLPSLKK